MGLRGVLTLDMIGSYLCLDFSNTVHNYDKSPLSDELLIYPDLVVWSQRAGILREEEARRLIATSGTDPRSAASVLKHARTVRRVIHDIFTAISAGREPRDDDLETLSREWARAMSHGRLTSSPDGYTWMWDRSTGALDSMLWPIVRSAVELLTSRESQAVRACAADGCTWLFLDRSKNRSRRWCEMDSCGNREKARRHYQRTRAQGRE